ncbi:MAG: HAMP domain-containing protein [Planctomycetes bacterium]|nr:HAMP domain-containing protein [Planctomycetota bacterium]
MMLRSKLLLVVCVMFTMFMAVAYFVREAIVIPEFETIERRDAVKDMERCVYALERDAEYVSSFATDYGAWDDTYRFIQDGNAEYRDENLVPETFHNLNVNAMLFVRNDGTLVWGQLRKSKDEDDDTPIDAPDVLAALAKPDTKLTRHETPDSTVAGVVITSLGPMMVGSSAITTSNREGEVRGAVIMARFLNETAVKELSRRAKVNIRMATLQQAAPEDRAALLHLAGSGSTWTDDSQRGVLCTYLTYPDLFGKPALLVRTDLPRIVSQRAAATTNATFLMNLAGGLGLVFAVWVALSRIVIEPLARVTKHAVRLGTDGNVRARLGRVSRDEIGTLSLEFDRMVDRLADAQSKLVDLAHAAGRSQVAADVLHNVGNVLNSVTVSVGMVADKVRNSEAPTVGQAAQLLLSHQDDLGTYMTSDDRGRQLPEFLETLGTHLLEEQKSVLEEMASLSQSVSHIRAVIQSQQAQRTQERLLESVAPEILIDQALQLSADAFTRHSIRMERVIQPCPPLVIDRHRVLQILVNLLTNAKQAIKTARTTEGVVSISLRPAPQRREPGG